MTKMSANFYSQDFIPRRPCSKVTGSRNSTLPLIHTVFSPVMFLFTLSGVYAVSELVLI